MLEEMGAFFDARLKDYEAHQLDGIESAREFYPFTAACLPKEAGARVLDLGCGTGLELESYFPLNPSAKVTGVDLAPGMLDALRGKFFDRALTLICGSYFDVPFGEDAFDAAVSVESLHHFTQAEKIPLYAKLLKALKPGGFFILTDYFAQTDEEERQRRQELIRLKAEQGLIDGVCYHYDTPLTAAHETEALQKAGFASVEVLRQWGATCTLKAVKEQHMKSILIKDTTREERMEIVRQALWGSCGAECEFCSGCDNMGGGRIDAMYQPYIDGEKEIAEINAAYRAPFVR